MGRLLEFLDDDEGAPRRLRGLRLGKVALVDRGSNPKAHIEFFKSHGGGESERAELIAKVRQIEEDRSLPLEVRISAREALAKAEQGERKRKARPNQLPLGTLIAKRRTDLGLSQSETARRLGISQPSLSRIESGGGLSRETFLAACRAGLVALEDADLHRGPMP